MKYFFEKKKEFKVDSLTPKKFFVLPITMLVFGSL